MIDNIEKLGWFLDLPILVTDKSKNKFIRVAGAMASFGAFTVSISVALIILRVMFIPVLVRDA